jgi:hypothetical protein
VSNALARDEQPLLDNPAALHGAKRATQRLVFGFALFVDATELNPGISQAIVILATQQQIPLHPFGRISIGLHPLRRNLAIQEERELERQHTRFAGPVVSAQKQSTILITKFLLIKTVKIDQPATNRLPAFARHGASAGSPLPSRFRLVHDQRNSAPGVDRNCSGGNAASA